MDFKTPVAVPREFRKDPGVDPKRTEVLADVKTLGFPKRADYFKVESYRDAWVRIATREASPAVAKRALKVHREYLSAAKKLDERWLTAGRAVPVGGQEAGRTSARHLPSATPGL